MFWRKLFDSFNLYKQCRKYGLPFWQCPQFLFILAGLSIATSATSSVGIYLLGAKYYQEPEIAALVVLAIAVFLMIIGFLVIRSFERLAEASRLKSEFISIVSHQLRSPLSNMKWAIDLLAENKISDEKKDSYWQILKENSQRMARLVSDLLAVSRIEAGGLVIIKEPFSLSELVKKIAGQQEIFAKAANIKIILEFNESFQVLGDSSQVSQVIINLLDNALHYILNGGEIRICLKSSGKNQVLFEIYDNGIGIPPEDRDYIFGRFFRGGGALRSQTQGSGLGLYIAKSIIEKLGGKIGFRPNSPKGSIFWFVLPAYK